MGVWSNARNGSVLQRSAQAIRCAHAINELRSVDTIMNSTFEFSYDGIDYEFYDCRVGSDTSLLDQTIEHYVEFVPYRLLAMDGVVTSIAQWHKLECRASQSFGLDNRRWSVNDPYYEPVFAPLFRLKKDEFWSIYSALGVDQFPTVLGNRSRCTPEESFMVWLRRMGSRSTLIEIGHGTFGASPTRLSHIFNTFSEALYDRFSKDACVAGVPIDQMPRFADAIKAKSEVGLDNCIAFLDTKATEICRSTDYLEQMANYNGHYGYHCLRWQSLHGPDGITYHLWGPVEGRRSDNYLLYGSDYHGMFVRYERALGYPVCTYADAGYWCSQYVQTGFRRQNGERVPGSLEDIYTKRMNKCRTCVEWGFGQVRGIFPFTESPAFMRLGSTATGQHYMNATFMTNVLTCLRGNITSRFFRLAPPSLGEYLRHARM